MRHYPPYLKDRDREGMIKPGDVDWFPKEDWLDHSYIWGKRDNVWISAVAARHPRSGALRRLFTAILASGRKIVVPTPLSDMPAILVHMGFDGPFTKYIGKDHLEIWIKESVPNNDKHKKT